MQTSKWGHPMWEFLLVVCEKHDQNIKLKQDKLYLKFLDNMKYLLPCIYCRESYSKFITITKIQYFSSTKNLIYWLYNIKCLVNHKLNKQNNENLKQTFNEFLTKYKSNKNKNQFIWNILLLIGFNIQYNKQNNHKDIKILLQNIYILDIIFKQQFLTVTYQINNPIFNFLLENLEYFYNKPINYNYYFNKYNKIKS